MPHTIAVDGERGQRLVLPVLTPHDEANKGSGSEPPRHRIAVSHQTAEARQPHGLSAVRDRDELGADGDVDEGADKHRASGDTPETGQAERETASVQRVGRQLNDMRDSRHEWEGALRRWRGAGSTSGDRRLHHEVSDTCPLSNCVPIVSGHLNGVSASYSNTSHKWQRQSRDGVSLGRPALGACFDALAD